MADIQKFDPQSLGDKLKERIRGSIADLIPDEQWDAMMKKELESFFKDTTEMGSYDRKVTPSTFKQVFTLVIQEEVTKRLREYLNGPDFQSYWDGHRQRESDALKKFAAECAPMMLENLVSSMVSNWVMQIRNGIPR